MPNKAKTLSELKRERGITKPRDNRESAHRRGYDKRWQRFRLNYLKRNPLCVACSKENRVTAAREVDHIIPLRQAPERKYDESNLQGLCSSCHSRKTAKENGGFGNG